MRVNEFKQPIGEALDDFVTPSFPDAQTLEGSYGRLTKLSIEHINDLYDVLCDVESRRIYIYILLRDYFIGLVYNLHKENLGVESDARK